MRPLSAVLVDPATARREQLMALMRAEGIRVVPVNRVANLEMWPVADVLVTYVAHSTHWWITGAAHVILLADTDEERSTAQRSGAVSVVSSGDTAALLSLLRTIAAATTAPG
jgi:hypothetical protein